MNGEKLNAETVEMEQRSSRVPLHLMKTASVSTEVERMTFDDERGRTPAFPIKHAPKVGKVEVPNNQMPETNERVDQARAGQAR